MLDKSYIDLWEVREMKFLQKLNALREAVGEYTSKLHDRINGIGEDLRSHVDDEGLHRIPRIVISPDDPTPDDGVDGDIWLKHEP